MESALSNTGEFNPPAAGCAGLEYVKGNLMNVLLEKRPVDVLLVVNDIQAVRNIRQTLEEAKVQDRVHHIGDMHEARAYLRREEPYQDVPTPGLIVLEDSLRNRSEVDLLEEIKVDPKLVGVSVVILARSSSSSGSFEKYIYSTESIKDEAISLSELALLLGPGKAQEES